MFSIRNFIPQTLLARFILIIIIPTLIGQLLIIFLFYDRHWYNVSYYTSNIISNEIKSLIDNHKTKDFKTLSGDYLNLSYQFFPKAKLKDKQLKINEELGIFKNILDVKINEHNIVRINQEGKIEVLLKVVDGLMIITFSSKLLVNPTTYIFVLWLVFLTILLLSVSLIFSRNQIKSILALANAAEAFGQGLKPNDPYKPSGAQEIRKAGIAFLRMKDRIERQITKRTQMLAMISHDLRTPLTRMKLQLELMAESEEKEGFRQDIESMQQMINSYLDFARGEGGEEFEVICISPWVSNLISKKWQGFDIDFTITETEAKVQIKPLSFARAISNLIANSIKYATKTKISIYASNPNIIIEINDNGNGIKDNEKDLLFKPFYRSDKSRPLDSAGNVGLGLAITKEIITGHYGNISLENSQDLGGLLVKITLPMIE